MLICRESPMGSIPIPRFIPKTTLRKSPQQLRRYLLIAWHDAWELHTNSGLDRCPRLPPPSPGIRT